MAIEIHCPHCSAKIKAPETVIGKQVRCPSCKNAFTAALPEQMEAPPEPAYSAAPMSMAPGRDYDAPPPAPAAAAPLPRRTEGDGSVMDYLLFRRMITPVILTAFFYVVAAFIVLTGCAGSIFTLMGSLATDSIIVNPTGLGPGIPSSAGRSGLSLFGFFLALIQLAFTFVSLILWRIVCEILIVIFRISETLTDIRQQQTGRS
jgi:predicted Zn finger-like uncharacterized protein